MAEGGARLLPEDCDECCSGNTIPVEEQPRLHTERLVSNRSRETERKISFPERGFRPRPAQPVALEAVADPFGEQDEEVQAEARIDVEQAEELVQARNPHPAAAAPAPGPGVGFANRQESNGSVRWRKNVLYLKPDTTTFIIPAGRHLIQTAQF